MQKVKENCK